MNPEHLLQHFGRISEAPDAIPRLRRFILDLAVRGKLVEQDTNDEPAGELLKRIQNVKARLVNEGVIKKARPVTPVDVKELPFASPIEWHFIRLGDVLEMINGRAFKPIDWIASGLPIVRIQNLNNVHAPFNFCDPESIEERHLIRDDEFLISWSGTPGTSFGAFIWKRGLAALNQHIFRCIQIGDSYWPDFLRLAINSQLDVLISKAQGGVGLQHVTKGTLESLPIPLPPIAEQHRIVAKVDELMALCDRLQVTQTEREQSRDRLVAASLNRLNQSDQSRRPGRDCRDPDFMDESDLGSLLPDT
ncbi:restriction endonuclease subunit S, partial [Methylicorpusculum sp.]